MSSSLSSPLLRPGLCLLVLTLGLACAELARQLPGALWWQALFSPELDDARQAVVHFSWLPRLAICLLAGAALGLAGTLMQQVLRNPLASPTTLGVASGGAFGAACAILLGLSATAPAAFAGSLGALGLVWLLGRRGDATRMVLAGVVFKVRIATEIAQQTQ